MAKVINILKDGTICEDMNKVTVPKEVIERVADLTERKKEYGQNRDSKRQS